MRIATLVIVAALVLVQAELWFGKSGMPRKMALESALQAQRTDNDLKRSRNDKLSAEVRDLKEGLEMVEEKARYELGMVKADEILVQISTRP
jgi:cell division protein FtsB